MAYICSDCPRNCKALRDGTVGKGYCGMGELIGVARVMHHMWEEPCLGGDAGVEIFFLCGCNLKCVYCQNYKINGSVGFDNLSGVEFLTPEAFGELLINVSKTNAAAIGIVTGDHFVRQIASALTNDVKRQIVKPVIFNCGGYLKPETLELLRDKIDIFMPDFKYTDREAASVLSRAPDYPEVCEEAVRKCFELTGPAVFGEDGLMKKGVIVRHLVLPGLIANTIGVIDKLNGMFRQGDIVFSLMSQYLPVPGFDPPEAFSRLRRPISRSEYKKSIEYFENAENLTLGFTQDPSSADPSFIPDFP